MGYHTLKAEIVEPLKLILHLVYISMCVYRFPFYTSHFYNLCLLGLKEMFLKIVHLNLMSMTNYYYL